MRQRNQRGVTLVEISTVLGIVGGLAVMALPSLLRWREGLELRGAASEISGAMMHARTRSIVERRNYTVAFSESENRYSVTPDGGTPVGRFGDPWKSVDIYDDGTDPACPTFSGWDVVFRPNSSADPVQSEAVYLRTAGSAVRYRVRVLGVTGKITVEKWQGSKWISAV